MVKWHSNCSLAAFLFLDESLESRYVCLGSRSFSPLRLSLYIFLIDFDWLFYLDTFLLPTIWKKTSQFWIIFKCSYFQSFDNEEPYHLKDSDIIFGNHGLFLGNSTSEFSVHNPDLRLRIFCKVTLRAHVSWREDLSIPLYQLLQLLGELD